MLTVFACVLGVMYLVKNWRDVASLGYPSLGMPVKYRLTVSGHSSRINSDR
jgi:hypothetical protein